MPYPPSSAGKLLFPASLFSCERPTWIGRTLSFVVTISGQTNEFHEPMKLKSASVTSAGRASGTATFQSTPQVLAPSITAASKISFGILRKNCRTRKMPNVPAAHGTICAQ